MLTVQELAGRYGVTTGFAVRALAQIGYHAAQPEQPLSSATVAQFETAFGEKIRAARPAPEPEFCVESDVAPPPSKARDRFKPRAAGHARRPRSCRCRT